MKIYRQIIRLFFLLLAFASCEGEAVEEPEVTPPVQANLPPGTPVLKTPVDKLACTYTSLSFEWERAEDPEGGIVYYRFQLSEDSNFENVVVDMVLPQPLVTRDLESGKNYFWRVKAKDEAENKSPFSEVRSFYTEPDLSYNHIPYPPETVYPADRAEISSGKIILEWQTEDPDGDILIYDLYFGTTNPPDLLLEGLESNIQEVDLQASTTYFWKVVAKDPNNAYAESPVWTFKRN